MVVGSNTSSSNCGATIYSNKGDDDVGWQCDKDGGDGKQELAGRGVEVMEGVMCLMGGG